MRRSLWLIIAAVLIGAPLLGLLAASTDAARVLARNEQIVVRPSSGEWKHRYSLVLGIPRDTASRDHVRMDTVALTVGRAEFDAVRMGARVRVRRAAIVRSITWLADSAPAWQRFKRFITARTQSYTKPVAVSPLAVEMAGLARVVNVHAVPRATRFWQRDTVSSSDRSRWLHLVEVEFWAPAVRSLVRTIDVIDAGSIPGLHAGDIVQMHYDRREPRLMRLDDGMRTFSRSN